MQGTNLHPQATIRNTIRIILTCCQVVFYSKSRQTSYVKQPEAACNSPAKTTLARKCLHHQAGAHGPPTKEGKMVPNLRS